MDGPLLIFDGYYPCQSSINQPGLYFEGSLSRKSQVQPVLVSNVEPLKTWFKREAVHHMSRFLGC